MPARTPTRCFTTLLATCGRVAGIAAWIKSPKSPPKAQKWRLVGRDLGGTLLSTDGPRWPPADPLGVALHSDDSVPISLGALQESPVERAHGDACIEGEPSADL